MWLKRGGERRFALVTGYYKEERGLLERCLASVRGQSVAVDHIVIADGFPQPWIDDEPVRHIKLDRPHGDYGNTPRGIGALLAIAEDYDAIGFIDADNWLEPEHAARCLEFGYDSGGPLVDFIVCQRKFRRPDETVLEVADEPIATHVDTNCFFFLPGSFHALQRFAMIPNKMSAIGDRIFYSMLMAQKLRSRVLPMKTVNYHCLWKPLYETAGETPPEGAKPAIDMGPIRQWLAGITREEREIVSRRTGLQFG